MQVVQQSFICTSLADEALPIMARYCVSSELQQHLDMLLSCRTRSSLDQQVEPMHMESSSGPIDSQYDMPGTPALCLQCVCQLIAGC